MINKILLTLAVIVGVYLLVSFRKRRSSEIAANPNASEHCKSGNCNKVGWLLAAALVVSLAGLGVYLQWSQPDVVSIKIVNTQNDHVSHYLASPDDVENRRFVTLDGREIILADTERMEVSHP